MAVELFTDSPSSRGISPRISFSHDLNNSDIVPIEPHIPLKASLLDFDFDTTRRSYDQDQSLADELFANGIILPIQIKRKNIPIITKSKSFSPSSSSSFLPPLPPSNANNNVDLDDKNGNNNNINTNINNGNYKSFWKFKRSKSLNCGSLCKRGLCPLPLLSRSKSTGSTSAKRSLISKDETHHRQQHSATMTSSQYGSIEVGYKQSRLKNTSSYQKPPLKKNYGGGSSFNSGIFQVSPVLNVPTGKVFGFGSIFSTTKDKGKKK